MQTHAVVELEDGALSVVVGGQDGAKTRILRSLRLALPDLGREAVANALRALGSDVLQGASGVHVVLGERRTQHFISRIPRLSPADTIGLVVREALRLTNISTPADLLVATRLLQQLPAGKSVIGTTAISRGVWSPIAEALRDHGIEVLGLHSMEACLALAAPSRVDKPVAVLEVNSGRARFVLSEHRCPVQVRRFLIGNGAEGNSAALMTQLAMELPRTIDWLREAGQALPQTMVLGTRLPLAASEIEMLKGDEWQSIVPSACEMTVGEGQIVPSLGVLMLLRQLGARRSLPSLLDAPSIRMPWRRSQWLGLAAAAVTGVLCSWSAVVDGVECIEQQQALAAARAETTRIDAEIDAHGAGQASMEPARTDDERRLGQALAMRRPISRLVADISNCAGAGLFLDELKFASAERLSVTGLVEGQSRKDALAAMAAFARRVRGLDYTLTDGQDEITEVPGQRCRFRFRVTLSWRNS